MVGLTLSSRPRPRRQPWRSNQVRSNKLLREIARLQQQERDRKKADPEYQVRIRTAIITARNAPAHKRLILTLRDWGIEVDEALFLGGMEKTRILAEFRPHIFFDDQLTHLKTAAGATPSVHVPFGVSNPIKPEPSTK